MLGRLRQRQPRPSKEDERHLAAIRRCTQALILASNTSEAVSGKLSEATSPQDLAAVRSLRPPQQALLHAINGALAAGVERATIQSKGINRTIDETLVMSDLAYFVVRQVQLQIAADHSRSLEDQGTSIS